jgi:hypothetical protein
MSTSDVERRLTDLLHHHAEVAMSKTDTPAQLHRFTSEHGGEPPRRTSRRMMIGAASVAVAAVAAAVVWAAGPGTDSAEPAPVQQPTPDPVQVAEEYVAAYAAYDTEKVVAMADPSVDLADVRLYLARDEAFGVQISPEPCREGIALNAGTQVTCPFALHALNSEDVGRGPFENASFTIVVAEDGKVLEAEKSWNHEINGMQQHVEAVTNWMLESHPDEAEFLGLEVEDVPAAQLDRWLSLWTQYSEDYVAAQSQE